MKYNIYIAGRYSRKEEFKQYIKELESLGHTVTSSWITLASESTTEADPVVLERSALACIKDITKSDCFLYFTDSVRENIESFTKDELFELSRGGRHVELGISMIWGVDRIILVGGRENIFHYIEDMECYDTFEECKKALSDVV